MITQILNISAIVVGAIGILLALALFGNIGLKTIFSEVEGSIKYSLPQGSANVVKEPSWSYFACKRVFDILFSFISLFLYSPVIVAIAIAIKLESKGPICYKRERIGLGGRPFNCYKFRTMFLADMEENRLAPRKSNAGLTRVGKFLRMTNLDEFPLFYNVLCGQMSVVGRSRIIEYRDPDIQVPKNIKDLLIGVKPGLVNFWIISRDRLKFEYQGSYLYDLYYLEHRSFRLDLKIIFMTITYVMGVGSKF